VNESGRVEAFSDGVFAIAITLLVLELRTPQNAGSHLWRALAQQWPSYLAYVVSFLVIGIMWANHHTVFGYVARVDRTLIFLNLLLLLVVAALPWPTSVLATYLKDAQAAHVAAAVYSAFMVAHAVTFQAMWWWLTRSGHLFDDRVDVAAARATRLRFALGCAVYPVLFGLAFVSAPLTLVLHGVMAVYYAFNQVPIPTRETREAGAVDR
jgi:uncharacterized membrane protein